jgi:hypothetical protein
MLHASLFLTAYSAVLILLRPRRSVCVCFLPVHILPTPTVYVENPRMIIILIRLGYFSEEAGQGMCAVNPHHVVNNFAISLRVR